MDFTQKLEALRLGKFTCVSNAQNFLNTIEKTNKSLNVFIELAPNVLQRAQELDNKRQKGMNLGKFYGLCFAIKSNISVTGLTISCASNTLKSYKGTFDAEVTQKILAEDGIILGIVNNDEFACGSSGETSAFGRTLNPKVPSRIPGGSSSGSAAAVAAQMCDIALGSDTGGSIRNPASHCGVVGVKPSYGRVSRYGLVDLGMSLDQIGPLADSTYACAFVLSVLAGYSKNDATTVNVPVPKYESTQPRKLKVGVIKTFQKLETDPRISKLFEEKLTKLKALGHTIVEVDVAHIDLAIQAYYPIVYTEFFSGTRKFDGVKYGKKIEDSCGEEVLRRILGGAEISRSEYDGAYYKKSLKVKEIIAKEFARVFKEVDVILSPVTPMLPHKFGAQLTPEQMYAYDAFTIPANLGGVCGGVVSKDTILDQNEQVPVGIQVMADTFAEEKMFACMFDLERI